MSRVAGRGSFDLRIGSIAFGHGFWLLSRRPPLRAREAAVQDSENSVYQMHEKDSEDSVYKMHEKDSETSVNKMHEKNSEASTTS